MKKSLKTLAKELELSSPYEYYNYCIDSHINGNFSQCRELFSDMSKEDQKGLIRYIESGEYSDSPVIKKFYFDLL